MNNFVFRPPQDSRTSRILLGTLLSLLAVGGALFGAGAILLPRCLSYEIRNQQLLVTSGLKIRPSQRIIPLERITEARPIRLERGKRKAGTSLPGYCAGRFSFPELGSVDLASDCGRDAVVLQTGTSGRPLVLTPKNRAAFLEAISGRGIYSETFHPGEGAGPWWRVLQAVFGLILLPVLAIPLIFFVSPQKLRYEILPGAVEIHTLIGTRRFSIGNCFAHPCRPGSSMKTFGSSLPGYHTGRFRVDGLATRVYATTLKEGVLIEGPDLRLFLSPENREEFLGALRTYGNIEVREKA